MADRGEARSSTARDAVVRPLSRAAVRPCARPGCPSPARATLSFRYATREAWLEGLAGEPSPAMYDLCGAHADRTRPPSGWAIVDQRPAADQEAAAAPPARDLGDEHTVAVLAAALRAVPDRPAEPAPRPVDAGAGAEPAPDVYPEDTRSPGVIALAELDHADEDDGVEDVLAELAAVARRDDAPEQIAIALDDDPAAGVAEAPVPRPVPAARDRAGEDDPGARARAW